jgi:hypothetical protein
MERGCSKSKDTCSSAKGSLQTYKIYSIIVPIIVIIFILEAAYVIYRIPGNIGSSMSISGLLPKLSSVVK